VARKHTPKGQIILKKEEKLRTVAAALPTGFSGQDFVAKFKEMYPKDWNNIVRRYEQHQRLTKPGKGHPMPEPTKYLLNIARNYIKT
jgi:hypothetical protein